MKIEGVIFDWAGTTVDYGCFAPVRAFAEIFREYGIEATMEETRKPMGMLKWDHIKTMLSMERINEAWIRVHGRPWTDRDVDEMHDKFAEKLMGILHEYTQVKPFVKEAVKELRRRNIKIGSTTGYRLWFPERLKTATRRISGFPPTAWETWDVPIPT